MEVIHYVYADVSLDGSDKWTVSYKHHSSRDTPHYVYANAPLEVPIYWMTYYTHHTNMDNPHCACVHASPGRAFY
jgi:hypothetical protein